MWNVGFAIKGKGESGRRSALIFKIYESFGCSSFNVSRLDKRACMFVALTASATEYNRNFILEGGFNGFLSKPVKLNDLLAELAKFLNHRIKETKKLLARQFIKPLTVPVAKRENLQAEFKTHGGGQILCYQPARRASFP